MDPSDNAGIQPQVRQRFRDVDYTGRQADLDQEVRLFALTEPSRFTGLAKAISQGDRALESKILRHWGIR